MSYKRGKFSRKAVKSQASMLKMFQRRSKARALSNRVKKLEKSIKKEISYKYVQDANTLTPTDNAATTSVQHLSIIPQGDGVSSRVGRFAIMKSLQIKGQISSGVSRDASLIRIIIFWARDVNGTLPTGDLILDAITGFDWLALREKNTQNDFVVHLDKTIIINNPIVDTVAYRKFEFYKKLNHKVSWLDTDSAGTIAGARDGHWFIMAITDLASGVPNMKYFYRFHYTDVS